MKNNWKIQNSMKSSRTNTATPKTGATNLPTISDSFWYVEGGANNGGQNIFCSSERTDIIQISYVGFHFNCSSSGSSKSMCCFRNQLLLGDDKWSILFKIPKKDSDSSTQWILPGVNFMKKNYGIKLVYDEIDSSVADMSFSNISITHSVYHMTHVIDFEDLYEARPYYSKTVISRFLIKIDVDILHECGYLRNYFNRLCFEF